MNDISLIGHMSGEGKVVADKLRRADYTTLQKILEEKPSVLAKSTGLEPDIISKIISSAEALSGTRPTAKTEAKAEEKVVQAALPQEKAKEVKKPAEKPKETIAEKPILDPLQRIAHELAKEHEIAESTALKLIDVVKKSPAVKEKILKEAIAREKFREKLARNLIKELT